MSQMEQNQLKNLADSLYQCNLTISEDCHQPDVVLDDKLDPKLISRWPKLNELNVPAIFLHQTADIIKHIEKMFSLNIKFYRPCLNTNYTKIICSTFNDHKSMLQYLNKNKLLYHTFGHPSKRKMKVVIRGLPKDTNLNKLGMELKAANIPIVRVHVMHRKKVFTKAENILVLAVVPYTNEGKNILRVRKIFGHDVTLEPPVAKSRQCHRCQKWGHSQRYCQGQMKCLKCAGDHITKKCTRGPDDAVPPTCANCGENHTANYRECIFCPDSAQNKLMNKYTRKTEAQTPRPPRELFTPFISPRLTTN